MLEEEREKVQELPEATCHAGRPGDAILVDNTKAVTVRDSIIAYLQHQP